MTLNTPSSPRLVGTCDHCGSEGVAVTRYGVRRYQHHDTPGVSRTLLLCASCGAPVAALLRNTPPKRTRVEPVVKRIDELILTPALLAQMGEPKRKRPTRSTKKPKRR